MTELQTRTTEYGASYTDDPPEDWSTVREEIEICIANVRAQIIAGTVDADDYEPIVLMQRSRIRRRDILSAWRPVLVLDDLDPLIGPQLATADDVIAGRATYAQTPGGHADREHTEDRTS